MRSLLVLGAIAIGLVTGEVKVKLGEVTITGVTEEIFNRDVDGFKGIPYGTRDKPFDAATPVSYDKKGKLDASKARYICPQVANYAIPEEVKDVKMLLDILTESEGAEQNALECQRLDVYRTADAKNAKLIIYIHGGGMDSGARNQSMNRVNGVFNNVAFVETDAVVVSIGYSLGPWGAFTRASGDPKDPKYTTTNVALLDILTALKWTQDHIAAFGGCLDDVTIVGHSAGATLTHMIQFALRDAEKYGLEKLVENVKFVLMSGTAFLFPPITQEASLARQDRLVQKTKCAQRKDRIAQYTCLEEELSDKELLVAARDAAILWGPIIDESLLIGDAEDHIKSGKLLKAPTLVTVTSNESSLFTIAHFNMIEKEGMNVWQRLGHSELIEHFTRAYGNIKDKFEAANASATESVFLKHAYLTKDLYGKLKIPIYIHQFSFVLEQLGSVYGKTISLLSYIPGMNKLMNLGFDLNKAKYYLKVMGEFHGLEQGLLFNASLGPKYRIGDLSSPTQLKTILSPLFDFILKGKISEQKIKSHLSKEDILKSKVDSERLLRIIYGGELPPPEQVAITDFKILREVTKDEEKKGKKGKKGKKESGPVKNEEIHEGEAQGVYESEEENEKLFRGKKVPVQLKEKTTKYKSVVSEAVYEEEDGYRGKGDNEFNEPRFEKRPKTKLAIKVDDTAPIVNVSKTTRPKINEKSSKDKERSDQRKKVEKRNVVKGGDRQKIPNSSISGLFGSLFYPEDF